MNTREIRRIIRQELREATPSLGRRRMGQYDADLDGALSSAGMDPTATSVEYESPTQVIAYDGSRREVFKKADRGWERVSDTNLNEGISRYRKYGV